MSRVDLSDAVVLGYYEGYSLTWSIAMNPQQVQLFDETIENFRTDGERVSVVDDLPTIYGMPVLVYTYEPLQPLDRFVMQVSLMDYAAHLAEIDPGNFS
jgi:hypothetical protein